MFILKLNTHLKTGADSQLENALDAQSQLGEHADLPAHFHADERSVHCRQQRRTAHQKTLQQFAVNEHRTHAELGIHRKEIIRYMEPVETSCHHAEIDAAAGQMRPCASFTDHVDAGLIDAE